MTNLISAERPREPPDKLKLRCDALNCVPKRVPYRSLPLSPSPHLGRVAWTSQPWAVPLRGQPPPHTRRSSMPAHVWTMISQASVIDKDTNNVSLFNVLESATFELAVTEGGGPVYPIPFTFHVVSMWTRTPDEPEGISAESRLRILL